MINRYFALNFMTESFQAARSTTHFDYNVLFILTVLASKSKLRSLFNPRTSTLTMPNGFYHKRDKKTHPDFGERKCELKIGAHWTRTPKPHFQRKIQMLNDFLFATQKGKKSLKFEMSTSTR